MSEFTINETDAVRVSGLRKEYQDFTLRDISFELPGGCITGLIGQNGAGKSTTLKLILGMIEPDGGSIQVLGTEMNGSLGETAVDVGVVLDEPCFPVYLTGIELDKVFANIYTRWDSEAFFGCLKKLNIPADKDFKDLSRGNRMKMSIAAALSHNPKLLVLDEATSGLDPYVRDEIVDLFYEFTREEDHSILISSHIVSDLEKLCDYIIFLDNGEILVNEEKDVLLDSFGILQLPKSEIAALPAGAVRGVKETPYGCEALVLRESLPGYEIRPASLEDVYLLSKRGMEDMR